MEQELDQHDEFDAILNRSRTQYRTVSDLVTSVIREAILTAAFRPGEHLRQDELARRLEVSRMPVRSALLQLESEGLVDFHPHRGAIVAELDADKVREMYDIRMHLEGLAVRKAIEGMTQDRLARLREMAERLDREQEGEDFLRLRVEFYDYLYNKERNPLLVELIQRLRSDVGRYWLRLRVVGDGHGGNHRELLNLVEKGDVARAQAFLQEHLSGVRDRLADLVEASRSQEPGSS